MSAPILWIFLPLLLGFGLMFLRNHKILAWVAGLTCILLSILAILLPIDTLLTIQSSSVKISPSLIILGRRLTLANSDRAWLALIYSTSAFWFSAASAAKIARRLIPIGLVITTLLVSALAVEPFLYAALLIEAAVLCAIPLLSPLNRVPGKGVLRFLIYQTIGMPFILFSGWLLAGIEANPGDLLLIERSTVLLGLGFALLLAVFPFYTWIPLLAEEAHPIITGFILWIFPTITIFFGLGFLDRYAWLRDAASLPSILMTVGVLMVSTSGILSLFHKHLGRMMGYAVICDIGFSLLGLAIGGNLGLTTFLLLCIPRAIGMGVWALGLTNLKEFAQSISGDNLKGIVCTFPFSTGAIVLASLSMAGLPLLASFPARYAIWESTVQNSMAATILVFAGSIGLTIAALKTLGVIIDSTGDIPWGTREPWGQRIFISLGGLLLLILGIFTPFLAQYLSILPKLFEHFGQ